MPGSPRTTERLRKEDLLAREGLQGAQRKAAAQQQTPGPVSENQARVDRETMRRGVAIIKIGSRNNQTYQRTLTMADDCRHLHVNGRKGTTVALAEIHHWAVDVERCTIELACPTKPVRMLFHKKDDFYCVHRILS